MELSPQQVVSCDTVDQGCDGGMIYYHNLIIYDMLCYGIGDPQTAYEYIMQAGGLQTDKDYPYYSGDSGWSEKCEVKPDKFVAHVANFSYGVPPCNDTCKNQTQYEQTVRVHPIPYHSFHSFHSFIHSSSSSSSLQYYMISCWLCMYHTLVSSRVSMNRVLPDCYSSMDRIVDV